LRCLTQFRASLIVVTILAATAPLPLRAGETGVLKPSSQPASSNIVIGFVGGFVAHDNRRHGPVVLASQIRRMVPADTFVQVFENRHRKRAYDAVLRLLDLNHDGLLSADERARARIILFGHSWGASAAVSLARDLRRLGIPVLLTVQVDSVAKLWQNDSIIPDNVAEAVNFYQTQGFVHGRRQIVAADPVRTEIIGNYRMDYKTDPVSCPEASWWYRVFETGHMQSECDPHLMSRIESMVSQRLSMEAASAIASPATPQQPSR
jgi:pimeloyl-ACP methyl ester carboxylesterase